MNAFYNAAAHVLKPGGTLALWTVSSLYCRKHLCFLRYAILSCRVARSYSKDPSTPNARDVQAILFDLERNAFDPYELPGNRLSRDMYDSLPLPWTVDSIVPAFPKDQFFKFEWDRDGVLSSTDGHFFLSESETSLEELEKGISSSSLALRWKAANPQLAGTEEDAVKKTMNKLRETMGGKESLVLAGSVALLLFRRA